MKIILVNSIMTMTTIHIKKSCNYLVTQQTSSYLLTASTNVSNKANFVEIFLANPVREICTSPRVYFVLEKLQRYIGFRQVFNNPTLNFKFSSVNLILSLLQTTWFLNVYHFFGFRFHFQQNIFYILHNSRLYFWIGNFDGFLLIKNKFHVLNLWLRLVKNFGGEEWLEIKLNKRTNFLHRSGDHLVMHADNLCV